jgi:hypothetical protein
LRKTSEKAVFANGSKSMLLFSFIFLFLQGFVLAFGTKEKAAPRSCFFVLAN